MTPQDMRALLLARAACTLALTGRHTALPAYVTAAEAALRALVMEPGNWPLVDAERLRDLQVARNVCRLVMERAPRTLPGLRRAYARLHEVVTLNTGWQDGRLPPFAAPEELGG